VAVEPIARSSSAGSVAARPPPAPRSRPACYRRW